MVHAGVSETVNTCVFLIVPLALAPKYLLDSLNYCTFALKSYFCLQLWELAEK